MLTIRLETYDGAVYELPTLLEWDVQLTGSVPCDSLWASFLYDPGMAEVLPRAVRFTALREGGLEALIRDCCDATIRRARELGR